MVQEPKTSAPLPSNKFKNINIDSTKKTFSPSDLNPAIRFPDI